jgi:hypothetical protein
MLLIVFVLRCFCLVLVFNQFYVWILFKNPYIATTIEMHLWYIFYACGIIEFGGIMFCSYYMPCLSLMQLGIIGPRYRVSIAITAWFS